MKVYLSGPMRGLPEWNGYSFSKYRKQWEEAGHQVFCPWTAAEAMGYRNEEGENPDDSRRLRHVIVNDVNSIVWADALAVLPAWETSRGAVVEVALAQFLGLPIFDARTMERTYPVLLPWNELAKEKLDAPKDS